MRLIFVKHSLVWPRSSGHDVHTFNMMKSCAELGHEVALATVVPPERPAIDGAEISELIKLNVPASADALPLPGTRLQHRFRSFWGIEDNWVLALRAAVERLKPTAVIVGGLDALPYFPALTNTIRVWYAADEWVLHHLSQLQLSVSTWREHLKDGLIKGLYERVHRGVVDRAWVVTEADQRAMRRFAGMPVADLLPNGVDATMFTPGPETQVPRTAVFWGRLDFGPNIQALEWFTRSVWPKVRQMAPDARFTIIGFQPTDAVKSLAGQNGITLMANVRDLRSLARANSVAVMPFVSGGGIKNKLLEAAALGLPIVGTTTASQGLRGDAPVITTQTAEEMAAGLTGLWNDEERRTAAGRAARRWVVDHHSWAQTAREAMAAIEGHQHRSAG